MQSDVHSLTLDALHYRRANNDGSCLVTNLAAKELASMTLAAMPVVEDVLLNTVAPKFETSMAEVSEFIGLSNLIGAYFALGLAHDHERMVRFLSQLPHKLRLEVVKTAASFVSKSKFRTATGLIPADALVQFVEQYATNDHTPDLQTASRRSLSFMK